MLDCRWTGDIDRYRKLTASSRWVIKSFLSFAFLRPAKAIFVPGIYFLGFSRYCELMSVREVLFAGGGHFSRRREHRLMGRGGICADALWESLSISMDRLYRRHTSKRVSLPCSNRISYLSTFELYWQVRARRHHGLQLVLDRGAVPWEKMMDKRRTRTQWTPLLTLAAVYENPSTWPDWRPKRPCKLGPTLLGPPASRVWHCAQRVCKVVSVHCYVEVFHELQGYFEVE